MISANTRAICRYQLPPIDQELLVRLFLTGSWGQTMLGWEADHPDNPSHMSRQCAWTDRKRKRLTAQDTIPLSDDEESDEDSDGAHSSADTVKNVGDAVHEDAPPRTGLQLVRRRARRRTPTSSCRWETVTLAPAPRGCCDPL